MKDNKFQESQPDKIEKKIMSRSLVFDNFLKAVIIILASSILILTLTRFVEIFFPKIIYKKNSYTSPDSTAIPISNQEVYRKFEYLDNELTKTQNEMNIICEKTISASRDIITFVTLLLGILSVGTIYRIILLKRETTDLIKENKKVILRRSRIKHKAMKRKYEKLYNRNTEIIKKFQDDNEQVIWYRHYFDFVRVLRNDIPEQIRKAVDFFWGQAKNFINDPYVIASLNYAYEQRQNHELKALILRTLISLGDYKAINELIIHYKDKKLNLEEKNHYKLALQGLHDLENPKIESILKDKNILKEI